MLRIKNAFILWYTLWEKEWEKNKIQFHSSNKSFILNTLSDVMIIRLEDGKKNERKDDYTLSLNLSIQYHGNTKKVVISYWFFITHHV